MNEVDKILLVLSGKGGVGKSTFSVRTAIELTRRGLNVGLLDVDLCGPSIPAMLGVENAEIFQTPDGWEPVNVPINNRDHGKLSTMSISFLLKSKSQPVIWRGPKKTSMIKHFIDKVNWGKLDFLIVDTPPGTSDEHITVIEALQGVNTQAVIVTTPQLVSIGDVRREVKFCRKAGMPIVGIVENMNGYVCPHCSDCTYIFSSGGGEQLAVKEKLVFLGGVPINPNIAKILDSGKISELFEAETSDNDQIRKITEKMMEILLG